MGYMCLSNLQNESFDNKGIDLLICIRIMAARTGSCLEPLKHKDHLCSGSFNWYHMTFWIYTFFIQTEILQHKDSLQEHLLMLINLDEWDTTSE